MRTILNDILITTIFFRIKLGILRSNYSKCSQQCKEINKQSAKTTSFHFTENDDRSITITMAMDYLKQFIKAKTKYIMQKKRKIILDLISLSIIIFHWMEISLVIDFIGNTFQRTLPTVTIIP